jgi:hypothetical protein
VSGNSKLATAFHGQVIVGFNMDVDGFLSEDTQKGREISRATYAEVFAVAEGVNRLAMRLQREAGVGRLHGQQAYLVNVLFVRCVEIFQSIVLMLEIYHVPAAKVLTRALLEAVFKLVAIASKECVVKNYFAAHYENLLKRFHAVRDSKDEQINRMFDKKDVIAAIEDVKKKKNSEKAFSTFDFAREAGMEVYYQTFYRIYSDSAHSGAAALDEHFDTEDENFPKLAIGPNSDDLVEVFDVACLIFLKAMSYAGPSDEILREMGRYEERVHGVEREAFGERE